MQIEQTTRLWQRKHYRFSLAELAELSGWPEARLREWVNQGVLVPIDPHAAQWLFGVDRLVTVRMARRLREDFAQEPDRSALTATLLDRVHQLESEIRDLRAEALQYPRQEDELPRSCQNAADCGANAERQAIHHHHYPKGSP